MTITELKHKRAKFLDKNSEIISLSKKEGRDLSKTEQDIMEKNFKKIDNLNDQIEIKKEQLIREGENDELWQPITNFKMNRAVRPISPNVEYWKSMAGDSKGKRVPVLSKKAKLSSHVSDDTYEGSIEDYLIERARGFTSGKRTMDTSADSSMVPVGISSQIIDEARALSRIFQANARVFPMNTKTETIARIPDGGSASTHWKAENAPHTSSDIITEPLVFTAHTLISSVKSSVELAEDAGNLAQVVRNNLTNQLALELDRVALFGSGENNEPTGILNQNGIQTVDMGENGAELESYAPFSEAYEQILNANGIPNAAIYSPRTWGTLDRLVDQQNQPLNPPSSYSNLLHLPTSQVPNDLEHGSAENASVAFIADFSKLMVGVRTNLMLEVTRVGSDTDSSAWENLQIWWRAYLRADIQLMHPNHFSVIQGIIPAAS